ncbi:MAG: UTP--glucose-1-phosphate uridylyltransferase [Caldilineaceae bacterium]|nr:UTP--glucose-1-phosphate uridylyltransferase [Caldilineaceae bacterium]
MQRAGLPELMIQTFCHYYAQLVAGESGFIPNTEAQPVADLPQFTNLTADHERVGRVALDQVVCLKLNGGLGTSMGMQGPKSLLTAKDRLRFLDIIVQQILHLRETFAARLPLVLMNSFSTEQDTLRALEEQSAFQQSVPLSFLQHKEPKIWKADLWPAEWPADPSKEWCPPGHGDLYAALVTSGLLRRLLQEGYTYAFVSNSDNLGATLDLRILGYLSDNEVPFLMEVAERTPADRKGGHLAQRSDGQLILREIAQCPVDEIETFQDITRYQYFNTNNLWVHLPTLQRVLDERDGILGLPLIRNEKPIDPTLPDSERVYQLETAMGSAIASFAGAQALVVPRNRFVPVKKNNDLLLLWSDVYTVTPESNLVVNPQRAARGYATLPLITLDDRYYQLIDDAQARFPHGAPSLLDCEELRVEGDVTFGRNVVIRGKVQIIHTGEGTLTIEDDRVLEDIVLRG